MASSVPVDKKVQDALEEALEEAYDGKIPPIPPGFLKMKISSDSQDHFDAASSPFAYNPIVTVLFFLPTGGFLKVDIEVHGFKYFNITNLPELFNGAYIKILQGYLYQNKEEKDEHPFDIYGSNHFDINAFMHFCAEGDLTIEVLPQGKPWFISTGNEVQSEAAGTVTIKKYPDAEFVDPVYEEVDTDVSLAFVGPNGILFLPILWEEEWEDQDLVEKGTIQAKDAINRELQQQSEPTTGFKIGTAIHQWYGTQDCGTLSEFDLSTCSIEVLPGEQTVYCAPSL